MALRGNHLSKYISTVVGTTKSSAHYHRIPACSKPAPPLGTMSSAKYRTSQATESGLWNDKLIGDDCFSILKTSSYAAHDHSHIAVQSRQDLHHSLF